MAPYLWHERDLTGNPGDEFLRHKAHERFTTAILGKARLAGVIKERDRQRGKSALMQQIICQRREFCPLKIVFAIENEKEDIGSLLRGLIKTHVSSPTRQAHTPKHLLPHRPGWD